MHIKFYYSIRYRAQEGSHQVKMVFPLLKTLVFGGDFSKSDFTYTTTNRGKVWPASGKWEFVTDTQVKRDDGVVIDLKEWVVTSLKMEFDWAGSTSYGGRTASTSGKHVMQFAAQ